MAVTEEYLPISDLTPLSNVTGDDSAVIQTAGANGDVMLVALSDIVSALLSPVFATLANPEFTGAPTAPTVADPTAEDERIATTEFVQSVAAKKANVDSPEITGTALFSEAIPQTVNGDGDTVNLATQDDIAALNTSIETLNTNITTLTTAIDAINNNLTDMIISRSYTYAFTNLAAGATLSISSDDFGMQTISGYARLCIRRIKPGNAKCGVNYLAADAFNSATLLIIQNNGTSAVSGTAEVRVLYIRQFMIG